MKKLFLPLFAISFLLFSCASVQEKPDVEHAESVEDTDAATDASASKEEAAGDAEEGEQAATLFEAESEAAGIRARAPAPEGQGRHPGRWPIPHVQRRPRPLPPAEPRFLTRRAIEADGGQAETLEAEVLSEEESPQESERVHESSKEPQTAPLRERMPRSLPRAEPRPAPAQAEPLVSEEIEKAAEADEGDDTLPARTEYAAERPAPSATEGRTAEVEESVLGEGQPFEAQPPSGEEGSSAPEAPPEPAEEPELQEEEPPPIEPSRSVSLLAGQNLEVWYPGAGWVFLGFGESSTAGGMTFGSRRAEGHDTIFSFRALHPGTYILEFSRFDVLTGGYIEDALLAEVLAEGSAPSGDEGRVVRAPDYGGVRIRAIPQGTLDGEESVAEGELSDEPSVTVTPALPAREGRPSSGAAQGEGAPLPEGSSMEEADIFEEGSSPFAAEGTSISALNEARAMIEEGDIEGALSAFDSFFAEYANDTDEALFLLGQAYEADSPYRDMRRALSAYETLTSNYPLSRFWQEADRRIRYIRRFYFDMR